MKTFVKLGVAALAATLAAGTAFAATAPTDKAPATRAHHHADAKVAHRSAHKHHVAHQHKVAHQHMAAGKIQRMNGKTHTVTVNHRVYQLSPKVASSSLKRGDKVRIIYTKSKSHRVIEKISPVSA